MSKQGAWRPGSKLTMGTTMPGAPVTGSNPWEKSPAKQGIASQHAAMLAQQAAQQAQQAGGTVACQALCFQTSHACLLRSVSSWRYWHCVGPHACVPALLEIQTQLKLLMQLCI